MGTRERPALDSGRKSTSELDVEVSRIRRSKGWSRRSSHGKSKTEPGSLIGRKSVSDVEPTSVDRVAAFLQVKVMAADMPETMQVHAFRCARKAYDDGLDKFSTRQIAHDIKMEFDKVYEPLWHCIVGTNYGSFVTHSTGCFLYFSMDKINIMLFKTRDPRVVSK